MLNVVLPASMVVPEVTKTFDAVIICYLDMKLGKLDSANSFSFLCNLSARPKVKSIPGRDMTPTRNGIHCLSGCVSLPARVSPRLKTACMHLPVAAFVKIGVARFKQSLPLEATIETEVTTTTTMSL